jgi:hypothetical protein
MACHRKWQRTKVRKASRARAPDSPMSGEGMDTPNGPTDEEYPADEEELNWISRSVNVGSDDPVYARPTHRFCRRNFSL